MVIVSVCDSVSVRVKVNLSKYCLLTTIVAPVELVIVTPLIGFGDSPLTYAEQVSI